MQLHGDGSPGTSIVTKYNSASTLSHFYPIFSDDYAGLLLRISESPASRMAMVEHRYSLPQAVPSSI
jgi:hypothetical protein